MSAVFVFLITLASSPHPAAAPNPDQTQTQNQLQIKNISTSHESLKRSARKYIRTYVEDRVGKANLAATWYSDQPTPKSKPGTYFVTETVTSPTTLDITLSLLQQHSGWLTTTCQATPVLTARILKAEECQVAYEQPVGGGSASASSASSATRLPASLLQELASKLSGRCEAVNARSEQALEIERAALTYCFGGPASAADFALDLSADALSSPPAAPPLPAHLMFFEA